MWGGATSFGCLSASSETALRVWHEYLIALCSRWPPSWSEGSSRTCKTANSETAVRQLKYFSPLVTSLAINAPANQGLSTVRRNLRGRRVAQHCTAQRLRALKKAGLTQTQEGAKRGKPAAPSAPPCR